MLVAAALPAAAQGSHDLAGWWLAIDDTFPVLWDGGGAAEELLIATPDGAVENRVMRFRHATAPECAQTKLCSDAPLVARARTVTQGNMLIVSAREQVADTGITPALAAAALTATPEWTIVPGGGNQMMTLRAGAATRLLVRIEPDRLRRLRAGMMIAALLTQGMSAQRHWRCFLANATAGDAAFAPLRKGKHAAPKYLADYLRIASYRTTLGAMEALPTADDPDADRRALVGQIEALLAERFKDVGGPRTAAEALRYRAQAAFIDRRATNASPQEANVVASGINGGVPVQVAATTPEYVALARVRMGDPEVRRLFCRE